MKILDLLCMPSRNLRKLISGFMDYASPVVPETSSISNIKTLPNENKMDMFDYFNKIKSGPTLGGPLVWEACLPQLLVRLSMPDTVIRDCLVVLLGRLIMQNDGSVMNEAETRLALRLVFPAVIAASSFTDMKLNKSLFDL